MISARLPLGLLVIALSCSVTLFPSQYDTYTVNLGLFSISNLTHLGFGYVYFSEIALVLSWLFFAISRAGPYPRGSWQPVHNDFVLFFLFPFLLIAGYSLIIGNEPAEVGKECRLLLYGTAIFLASGQTTRSERATSLRNFIQAVLLVALPIRTFFLIKDYSLFQMDLAIDNPVEMRSGDFSVYAATLFILIVADHIVGSRSSSRLRLLHPLLALLAFFHVIYSAQYGVLLYLVTSLIFLAWGTKQLASITSRLMALVFLGLILLAPKLIAGELAFSNPIPNLIPSMYFLELDRSFSTYTTLWQYGITETIEQNPFLGLGLGQPILIFIAEENYLKEWLYVHNVFLEMFTKGGAVLLFFWLLFLYRVWGKIGWQRHESGTVAAFQAMIPGFLVMGLFHPFLSKLRLAILFWLIVGTVATRSSPNEP